MKAKPQIVAFSGTLLRLGRVVSTTNALARVQPASLLHCLARHARGDWGDLCRQDAQANQRALLNDERILSVYHDSAGIKFYIITESDRSVTTVLLPEDY